jgi:hypothetical protein
VQISLLILFFTFTGSRPATLFTGDNSSLNDSQKGLIDDLSNIALVDDSDKDILINNKFDSKAQTIRPETIYYKDINLFLLRNPDNSKRDILMAEVNFRNLKGRPKNING